MIRHDERSGDDTSPENDTTRWEDCLGKKSRQSAAGGSVHGIPPVSRAGRRWARPNATRFRVRDDPAGPRQRLIGSTRVQLGKHHQTADRQARRFDRGVAKDVRRRKRGLQYRRGECALEAGVFGKHALLRRGRPQPRLPLHDAEGRGGKPLPPAVLKRDVHLAYRGSLDAGANEGHDEGPPQGRRQKT